MHSRLLMGAAVGLGLAVLSCSDPASPSQNQQVRLVVFSGPPTPAGALAKGDLYALNADGVVIDNLTNETAAYANLELSPDGQKVVFYSDRETCQAVWKMNLDGTELVNLTPGAFEAVRCNKFPQWSPDGTMISFSTSREGTFSVYVMYADGSDPHNVSVGYDGESGALPTGDGWTPDGRVLFHKNSGDIMNTYAANADGTNIGLLFGRTGEYQPFWSPDHSKVVFHRQDGAQSNVWVANADGSNAVRLTAVSGRYALNRATTASNPASPWSADGKWIVFHSLSDNQPAIEIINVDGTGRMKLTEYAEGAWFDGWSPDGRVTFHSAVSGANDIYLINRDKTGRVNLTNTPDKAESLALWLK